MVSFTQTSAPIACISFVDPNPPSPLIVNKVGCCCSVTKLCPALCDHMDCSMPGFSVLHYLPEFAQTHVRWIADALQLSHPVTPFSSAPNPSQHLGFFKSQLFPSGAQSIGAPASVLPMNIQGSFPLGLTGWFPCVWGSCKSLFKHHSSTDSILRHSTFFRSNSYIHTWLLEKP